MELDAALHYLYELSHQDLTLCRNCKDHCNKDGCIYEQAFDTVHVEILRKQAATAKWIKQDHGIGYKCSSCGKIVMADCSNELNYCCNCGVKMKGE